MEDFNRKEWLKTLKKGDKVANKERYGWETYQYLNCKNYGRTFRYCCSCVAKLEGICEGFKEIEAGDNTIEYKDWEGIDYEV